MMLKVIISDFTGDALVAPNFLPGDKNARYDFRTGRFLGADGVPIEWEDIRVSDEEANAAGARAARAGEGSLRRGILIQSLASSESSERPGLLENVLSRSAQLVSSKNNLKSIFSKNSFGHSENAVSDEPSTHRVIDGETLKQLRRAAAGLERTQDGVFLRVTEDGNAIATGPKGTRIPDAFRRFANDNDLAFYAERRVPRAPNLALGEASMAVRVGNVTHKSEPMPIAYRESGAVYFGEGVGESFDRTDRARFSKGSEPSSFGKWFGDSVMTEDGRAGSKPLVLYHGGFDFDAAPKGKGVPKVGGRGSLGAGFYLTPDATRAGEYAKENGGAVTSTFVKLNRPLEIRYTRGGRDPVTQALVTLGMPIEKAEKKVEAAYEKYGYAGSEIKTLAIAQGYDGIVEYIDGRMSEVVVWSPTQVKSATNNDGNYSWSPDIRFSRSSAQTETPEFKKWFGDWESFAILNGNPLAYLKVADAPQGRYKDIEIWAAAIFKKQGGIAVREGIGEILLDERSAKTAMAHSGANDYKKVAFASVKDVIERGALVHKSSTSEEDSFYFSAPIDIDGVTNIETVLVHRDVNTKRMYLHSVTTKENLLSKRVSGADDLTSKLAGSTTAEGIRRIIQDLIIGKDISKVVDKNGAPLVVYHGTMTSDLFEFNPRASVELYGRPEGIDAIGSWFSTDKSYAKGFGDNLAETYLSIKNPAVYESWEALMSEWSDENSSKSASKSAKTRHKANQHNGDAAAFRDLLIAEGFDGIQIKPHKTDRSTEFDGRSAYIAFSPTQIKSAIGNNGQFDGSNPDIRYSKASSSEQEETSKQFAKRSVAHAPEHQFHTAHCCNQR
jgi:hypothetical protein